MARAPKQPVAPLKDAAGQQIAIISPWAIHAMDGIHAPGVAFLIERSAGVELIARGVAVEVVE